MNNIFIWIAIFINVTIMLCASTIKFNSFSDYVLVGLVIALLNILCLKANKIVEENKKENNKDEL